jgi:predicted CXXCH cytochrome family protein
MQVATSDTVLGDFSDRVFSHANESFRFFRREGRFFVNAAGADGEPADFEIEYAFGVDPLQQYLVRLPGGRLQALTVAWDTRPTAQGGQRWFHLYPDERNVPGDPFHWTGGYQGWNQMCAECHSTNLEKRFDAATNRYATVWSEIDVSCEACHGPGSAHVAWADRADGPTNGLVVDFASADSRAQVDACGRCHARRHRVSEEDRRGRPLLDDFMPATLRPGLYHSDGQILDEVYVYGSFLQSAMYARGVRCSDCHDPHSLELRAEGNSLCTQCHTESGNPRFPSLTARAYDTPEHHFHEPGSAGSQCVSCHMPVRTYMQIDPRRDHSFRVPRPDLSAQLGTPNACTDCHENRAPEWAAKSVADWYGVAGRQGTPHFAAAFHAAREGAVESVPSLVAIAADPEQPAIVRATALELLADFGPSTASAAISAARDGDPLVRAVATRGLEGLAPEQRVAAASPLLRDPIRAVRVEAGRILASAAPELFDASALRARDAAVAEYVAAQRAQTDTPSAHLNLAVLETQQGEHEHAIASYRRALELDPDFFPARANLAVLYGELGRRSDAERLLREGIARDPERGEFHYSLALLLAEGERMDAAAGHLGRAAELLPQRARVHYNHGLALQRINQFDEAESALRRAADLAPRDPEIVYALTVFYVQRGRWNEAREPARQLVELTGGAPEALQLMKQIEMGQSAR